MPKHCWSMGAQAADGGAPGHLCLKWVWRHPRENEVCRTD
jgi:hypothetical protein